MVSYPFHRRSKLAAKSVCLAGCIVCIIGSIIINRDFEVDYHSSQLLRFLTSASTDVVHIHRQLLAAEPAAIIQAEEPPQTWYQVHGSTRLQWNMSPHHWKTCPAGQDMFVTDTGFTFHGEFPDPDDPAQILKSKNMRLRLERKDDRGCLWNYSKACLAGGNFIMNFGKSANDMRTPGDFTLKTTDGPIRIIAYNSNGACSRTNPGKQMSMDGHGRRTSKGLEPLDYLRQAKEYTEDPEKCQLWIDERQKHNDLFKISTDLATIHIDTPWMQLIIQVHQNKVATKTLCNYAEMHVWMTNVKPGFFSLDGPTTKDGDESMEGTEKKDRKMVGSEIHVVDGPWGI